MFIDARVFSNCNVNKSLLSGKIPPVYQELVPGYTPVPVFLIGDPAYPLLPNVMKEFSNCTTEKMVLFNNSLRTVRNQVECAFGRLKARWRILNRAVDIDLEFAVSMIYSCFILHNFCEKNKEDIKDQSHYDATLEDDLNYNNEDIETAMIVNMDEIIIEREIIITPNLPSYKKGNEITSIPADEFEKLVNSAYDETIFWRKKIIFSTFR